ncbi:hypothetical protein [Tsukamurella sp. PLM1]|uniref:hypothetical protein n=1 Tax=Tsukamurella sp. PLM1 TaxID=2929795 RepID=UPI0020621FC4|nr:hypothetical protein [Tsukamurella sp. PLM1]BDH58576.1 hypothetical protein MTP03_35150 [Tsukamurella sp. PLM1]
MAHGIIRRVAAGTAVVAMAASAQLMGTGAAQAAPAAPSASQLQAKLQIVMNRALPVSTRTAELADPSALTGANNISALWDTFQWAFNPYQVQGASTSGGNTNATLAVSLRTTGQTKTWPLHWVAVGDSWKLTKGTVCNLAAEFRTTC